MGSQGAPGQGRRAGRSHSMQARVGAGSALGQPGRRGWAQVDAFRPGEGLQVGRDVGGCEGSSWPQLGILLIPGPPPPPHGVGLLPHAFF